MVLRSAVGIAHVLRSGLVMGYTTSYVSHQFNFLKVKSSIDAESEGHYNKKLLECVFSVHTLR